MAIKLICGTKAGHEITRKYSCFMKNMTSNEKLFINSSCWDWLLMAAAKWQPAGRQMGAGGLPNGNQRGGKWKPAGRQMEAGGAANGSRRGGN